MRSTRAARNDRSCCSFQHYLTAFGGIFSIPLILSDSLCLQHDGLTQSRLINTIFFVSGLCTMLQVTFGVRSAKLTQTKSSTGCSPGIRTFQTGLKPITFGADLETYMNIILMNLTNFLQIQHPDSKLKKMWLLSVSAGFPFCREARSLC